LKLLKWVILSFVVIIVVWYSIDFVRYSDFYQKKIGVNDSYEKKRIVGVHEKSLELSVLKIEPDASYKLLEVKVSDETKISALGPKSLFVNNIEDLKYGQKVRVWYSTNADNEKIANKVIVYNLFNF
jgi:hypothetical protein